MRDYNKELYSNKSNTIIQNYAWALKEKQLKIMELLCSCYMTNYYDAEKNTITVGLADFMRELGYTTANQGGWAYNDFRKIIKELSDTSIIGIGFNGNERLIRLMNTFEYLKDTSQIKCFMSEDFKECMKLQDKGNTKIEFKTICSMNSRFSIKLYNLLRSWQGREEVYFDVDYLKELLHITAKSYDNFAKFRQAALDVAVDEINEKTNLKVSYKGLITTRGRSRKTTRVVFNIQKNEPKKTLPSSVAKSESPDQTSEDEFIEDYNEDEKTDDLDFWKEGLSKEGQNLTNAQLLEIISLARHSDYIRNLPFYLPLLDRQIQTQIYIGLQDKYTIANLKNKNSYYSFLRSAVKENWANIN